VSCVTPDLLIRQIGPSAVPADPDVAVRIGCCFPRDDGDGGVVLTGQVSRAETADLLHDPAVVS